MEHRPARSQRFLGKKSREPATSRCDESLRLAFIAESRRSSRLSGKPGIGEDAGLNMRNPMSQNQFDPCGPVRRSRAVPSRPLLVAVSLVLLGLSLPASLRAGPDPGNAAASGPNLLLIIADDHRGGSLGIEGDPHKATPNLDRLAREGILFERAFCNAPVCTPSRQSLITGKLPHAVGVTQLGTRLSDDVLTMGEWFRDLDYQTAAIGKMHFNGPSAHGFAERYRYCGMAKRAPGSSPARRRPSAAMAAVQGPGRGVAQRLATLDGSPRRIDAIGLLRRPRPRLFEATGQTPVRPGRQLLRPTQPVQLPEGLEETIPPGSISRAAGLGAGSRRAAGHLRIADLRRDFAASTRLITRRSRSSIRRSAGWSRALDAMKLSDQTLIVYVGDNGYMLGQHGRFEKHCFYEPAVRIPLILRWPGHLPRDRRISGLVEMVDILPTVLHLLNLPAPPGMQGLDLVPLIRGKPGASAHDFVSSEYLENEEAMVRSERFKLVVGTGRRLRQDGYQTGRPLPGPYQRLFDLVDDPAETRDLGTDPRHRAVKDDLLQKMYLRMVTTREGLVPVPPGLSRLETIHWCLIPRDRPAPIGE